MCGIAVAVGEKFIPSIESMTSIIAHRGPDDFGIWKDEFIGLGHRRLSIQDLSPSGHQPMVSDDQRYIIVFNGEIYNHEEVRSKLNRVQFKSTGDTETLLYAFHEFGIECLDMLNGIFSFAIYDALHQLLWVVRDPLGVKPLYFVNDHRGFACASELKALLELPLESPLSIDAEAMVDYLTFLWTPGSKTGFSNIKKLLPGHYLKLDCRNWETKISSTQYYKLKFSQHISNSSESVLIEKLQSKLYHAVKRQLISDVPVGFFLSGGLDSSAIVAFAAQVDKNLNLECFTIDTGEASTTKDGFASDLPYAKRVAEHLNAHLHIVSGNHNILESLDKMVWHLDEPQADPAPLLVQNICNAARERGIFVLLGGTGGDDLFSGYRRHESIYYNKYLNKIPGPILKSAHTISNAFIKIPTFRRLSKLLEAVVRESGDRQLASYYKWLDIGKIHDLFSDDFKRKVNKYDPLNTLISGLNEIDGKLDDLNKMLFWDQKYFLTDHNLNYTDKLSMSDGVEVRVPFLDLELLEFSNELPVDLKLKGKYSKYIFKKAMEPFLPHDVIYRSKSGFGAPVRHWIINELDDLIGKRLNPLNLQKWGVFDPVKVQQLVVDVKKGRVDGAYTVFSLLVIDSWLNQFAANLKKT